MACSQWGCPATRRDANTRRVASPAVSALLKANCAGYSKKAEAEIIPRFHSSVGRFQWPWARRSESKLDPAFLMKDEGRRTNAAVVLRFPSLVNLGRSCASPQL